MQQSMASQRRLSEIEGLRGIAALLVVLMHGSEIVGEFVFVTGFGFLSALHAVDFGRLGVAIFFLISGYLIPSSLHGSGADGFKLFWIRRVFRLYPAYWVSVPLAYFAYWTALDLNFNVMDLLANFTMMQEFAGIKSIQGLYWTLHVELVFYVFCSIAFLFGISRNPVSHASFSLVGYLVFVIAMACTLGGLIEKGGWQHTVGMYGLHLGMMFWAALFRSIRTTPIANGLVRLYFMAVPLGFVLLLAAAGWSAASPGTINPDILRLAFAYPVAFIVFLAFASGRFCVPEFLCSVGEVSYSLYLFHPVVLYGICIPLGAAGVFSNYSSEYGGFFLTVFLLAPCLIVAKICYRFVEASAMSMGRSLTEGPLSKLSMMKS